MLGIPFVIQRESERGVERETIYLRSRRRSEAGEKMRNAIREYNKHNLEQNKQAARAAGLYAKIVGGQMTELESLKQIDVDQTEFLTASAEAGRLALEAAEVVAEEALRDNYAQEQMSVIVDKLTDMELHAIVGAVEQGAMPKDFFTRLDTLQKQSFTLRSGDAPAGNSSEPVTTVPQSSEAK